MTTGEGGQFLRRFHDMLRRRYILLRLGKMFCNYLLDLFVLGYELSSAFLLFFKDDLLFVRVGYIVSHSLSVSVNMLFKLYLVFLLLT